MNKGGYEMDVLQLILASIGSIVAFVLSKEFFIPQIINLISWMRKEKEQSEDRTLDVGQEISKLKITEVERYEKTFETLLNQIEDLENELKSYSKELQELRNTILKLNSKLYHKSLVISDLQKKCCANAETCKNRIICKNYLCEVLEKEEDEDN